MTEKRMHMTERKMNKGERLLIRPQGDTAYEMLIKTKLYDKDEAESGTINTTNRT